MTDRGDAFLAEFHDYAEAESMRSLLESQGIEAEVEGFQANIFGSAPMEGVRLFVASEDLDAARALLPPPIEEGDDAE